MPGATAAPDALERSRALLAPPLSAAEASSRRDAAGFLDLLGGHEPPPTGPAQRLMLTRAVPRIYERLWRPALGAVATGVLGPRMGDEHRIARLLMGLVPGDGVLDVACGPGNFTRAFAKVVGRDGLAIGIDASATMLARAARDTAARAYPAAGYVRGDAVELPFRDASFDAVCCFAALHLFADPMKALDHMTRVLVPGGRIALLTSCRTRSAPLRAVDGALGRASGMRMFEPDEITEALEARGLVDVRRRIAGLTQFVGARLPRE
jgi:SAM-dependent methyltransferase